MILPVSGLLGPTPTTPCPIEPDSSTPDDRFILPEIVNTTSIS